MEKAVSKKDSFIFKYLNRMKAGKCCTKPKLCIYQLTITTLGSFIGISFVAFLSAYYNIYLLLPSFGATAVLIYAACQVPMAQPRNVIGGHFFSALMGVSIYQLLGNDWWTISLGVTLAILLMTLTHTLHPPGGATAFIAVFTEQNYSFIFSPVLIGAVSLVIIAVLVNNLSSKCKYPLHWL
ncbi:MAG: membrane protein [Peptococcaceae bacterium BICA1-8]|nr:MAG: membrane protein [Peptococcaceae bacterium BICA1-8]